MPCRDLSRGVWNAPAGKRQCVRKKQNWRTSPNFARRRIRYLAAEWPFMGRDGNSSATDVRKTPGVSRRSLLAAAAAGAGYAVVPWLGGCTASREETLEKPEVSPASTNPNDVEA